MCYYAGITIGGLTMKKLGVILCTLALLMGLAVPALAGRANSGYCKGVKLCGRVKVVNSFPDLKVKVVNSFPDLRVKKVNNFPDDIGEWQFVTSGEDFTIQYVNAFEDLKIQFVDAFPGPQ